MAPKYNRVAVIGAGISGLVSALHLKKEGIDVVIFERSNSVGGVWVYNPRPPLEPTYPSINPIGDTLSEDDVIEHLDVVEEILDVDFDEKEKILLRHAPPSPCYKGLTNNVSTPLMEIKNQPWPEGTTDFVLHEVLREYIREVPIRGSLEDSIRLNTRVSKLWKNENIWYLESIELKELKDGKLKKTRRVDEFDAVVIASGHYDVENVPGQDIPGLKEWKDKFPTKVQHSKGYRTPDEFAGLNVLLVGGAVSAMDIAKEIGPIGKTIIQSTRGGKLDLPVSWLPAIGRRVGPIQSFHLNKSSPTDDSSTIPGTVVLKDGTVLENIDRVIIATGYHMSYPFLRGLHTNKSPQEADDDELVLVTDGTQTHNLYKDIFYIPDPSLGFLGIPFYTATFSLFEFQAIALSKVFSGKAELPPRAAMREEYLRSLKLKGYGRDFHNLLGKDVEYANELLNWINGDGQKVGEKLIEGHSAQWHLAAKKMLERREETLRFKSKAL